VTVLLTAFASGYGYHRDELYFLVAGHHLAWAYADQGPLVPLIARAMSDIAPHSLTLLRFPSAVAAGVTVILTGLLARELGGSRRAQVLAATFAAAAVIVLFTGHLLSTSTFDLLAWTAITWLVVRAVRTRDDRLWPLIGVVLGVSLLNQPLPAFLVFGMLAGVAISGPRHLFRNRNVWLAGVIALALWSPWLIWQATHGWPQIAVSQSLANGHSTSSQPWWAIVPFQALLVSPPLAPVWIAGLVRLFRDPAVRAVRFLAWSWLVLAVLFMAARGKPYYLAGLLPVLLGAGAVEVDSWLKRGRGKARMAVLIGVLALSGVIDAVISLPILPARDAGVVIAVNGDVAETIGWPEMVKTVDGVYRHLTGPSHAVIFTSNYGEAGAIDRYGPALGLPRAYSGHNAFWYWGPPSDASAPVIVVGFAQDEVGHFFQGCTTEARITNQANVNNEEQGQAVMVCARPIHPWSVEWPSLRHLG
jgi:4-amino-4-deoxy-L-arabinose transferase-like glycosyltransferase